MDLIVAGRSDLELRFRDGDARDAALLRLDDPRIVGSMELHEDRSILWSDPSAFRMAIDDLDQQGWRIRFPRAERHAWIAALDVAPFASTAFRGERALKQTGYASDPGDLGTGRYLTTHRATAALYGPVGRHEISYARAASGETQSLLRAIDLFYRTCKGRDRVGGADLMRADFLECGIEALLINGYDSPEGHLTVVEFSSTPPRPLKPWPEPEWEEDPVNAPGP